MSGFNKYSYRTSSDEKRDIERGIQAMKKTGKKIEPIVIIGRKIATNWWGIAWNKNLESYADYANRIGRGKRYVKNGAVIDLKIDKGTVIALVQGSRKKPYEVKVTISPMDEEKWGMVTEEYGHSIENLEAMMDGSFPESLKDIFVDNNTGLFPSPNEINFACNCPDWAYMCKHVASVLYAIGAKFDENPLLFFLLRDIDVDALIMKSIEEKMESLFLNAGKKSERTLLDDEVEDLFGIAMSS